MTQRLPLFLALCLLLAGCGTLPGPAPPPVIYLLPPASEAISGPAVPWQLSVAVPSAPAVLDTERIALTRNGTLDYFANAVWTDRAPKLLQSKLVESLEKSGKVAGVAPEEDALPSDYRLIWDVRAFEATYTDNGAPRVTVRLAVKLVTAGERKVIGTKEFSAEVPAAANAMPEIVAAFGAATGQAMSEVGDWVLSAPMAAQPAEAPRKAKSRM